MPKCKKATIESYGWILIPTILVTSASKKAPLISAMMAAAKRIHPDAKVLAGDTNSHALAAYVADDFWGMPSTVDDNLNDIIQGCKQRNVTVVLPTRDGELLFWARYAKRFSEAGISVIVSPLSSLQVCLDKYAFFMLGQTLEMPIIPTGLTPDAISAKQYVVKERFGSGSKGIGLSLDKANAVSYARKLTAPIFQPYIQGTEISVDAWLDRQHRVKGLVLRRRDFVTNGESQITTTFRDAKLEAKCACLLNALELSGPVVVQAITDDTGEGHFIECNARFGGASTASIATGLDSLYWSLLETQGVNVADFPFIRIPGEVRQIRIPKDIYSYR